MFKKGKHSSMTNYCYISNFKDVYTSKIIFKIEKNNLLETFFSSKIQHNFCRTVNYNLT